MRSRLIIVFAVICAGLGNIVFSQSITLINPILSGFYPDPSVVKVGANYYLVNSNILILSRTTGLS